MTTKSSNEKDIRSREQLQQTRHKEDHKSAVAEEKRERTKEKSSHVRRKRIRIRLIPIWLRILIIVLLITVSVLLGAVVGYSVIGDGKATDVFHKETWTHIIDLIKSE